MRKLFFFFSTFLFFNFNIYTYGQYQNVVISNQYLPQETSIMISPVNPNIIVAGSNNYYNVNTSNSAYYYSTNGGLNWSGGNLISNVAKPSGDPVVIVDTAGYFYYIQNANWMIPPPNLDKFLIQRSTNGGINWSAGTAFALNYPKMDDKPWGCVDFSNSIYRNNIYVTASLFDTYLSHNPNDSSNIMFYRSTDGGLSFTPGKRLNKIAGNCVDSSNTVEGAVPCTGPNGEIYTSWSGPLGIVFDRSTDGGDTWLDEDIFVADQPGGWVGYPGTLNHYNGFPVTACDISGGPYNGTIYINWVDQRNGPIDQDVWLVKSTNGGDSWSQPRRVNDDPPGKNQYFTWMTIDQITGYLYFVFYDARNYSYAVYADVYVARSTDGGNTFDNIKVNSSTVNTNGYIGDYINISAYNNRVRPMWTDNYGYKVVTAIIDTFVIGIKPLNNFIPDRFTLYQNFPNPFNPLTKVKFDVSEKMPVTLTLYDVLGKETAKLADGNLSPGTYEIEFDGSNFPSGVYFYRLRAGDYSKTMKMVLVK
jgi:hypothetical protein